MTISAGLVKELRELTGAGMMECKKALQETNGDIEEAITMMRKRGQAKAAKRAGRVAAEGVIVIATNNDHNQAFIVEVNSETDFVARDDNFKQFAATVAQRGLAAQATDVAALLEVTSADNGGESIEVLRQQLVTKIGENIQVRRCHLLESDGAVGSYLHGDRIGVLVALDKADDELVKDVAMHVAASKPQAVDEDQISKDVINKERDILIAQAKESGKPDNIIEKMVDGRMKKFLEESCLVGQPFVKNPDQTVGDLLKAKSAKVSAFVRFEVGEGIEKETVDFADEVKAQMQGD